MRSRYLPLIIALLFVSAAGTFCSQPPPEGADEIVGRSYEAHGGAQLTDWQTMTVEGSVWMNDGIWYDAKYLVFAEKPNKLRVEEAMTADKGRIFYEYFMNGDQAWQRRNLIPRRLNVESMEERWSRLTGIAYYHDNAGSFTYKGDGEVEWKSAENMQDQVWETVDTTPAYVVTAVVESDTVDLFFDKDDLYLIQEVRGNTKRVYREFMEFDGRMRPTMINEILTYTRGGETRERITPYTIQAVRYDVDIEDYLFTEDMPGK